MLLVAIAMVLAGDTDDQATWPERVRLDVRAMHTLIASNHPGMVDVLNPGFPALNDSALEEALERAPRVETYAGYRAVMRGYTARFDDSHLAYSVLNSDPVEERWPGFAVRYDGFGRYVVAVRAGENEPVNGSVLVSCDDKPADDIARERLGAFSGRWALRATRVATAERLFIDDGNPFIETPKACVFESDNIRRTYALEWRSSQDERGSETPSVSGSLAMGRRILPDGTRWLAIPSFDGTPGGYVARRIHAMAEAIRSDPEARSGTRLVLDLRGNGGGSSLWSHQIAAALWGSEATMAAAPKSDGVDWRASHGNVERFIGFRERFATADASVRTYVEAMIEGLSGAEARGEVLWREPKGLLETSSASVPGNVWRGRVIIVTDEACASACLDAVDLWRGLGAIQVGRETDADSLYMDARRDILPSGLGQLATPMKVYRGRPRGSNEPARPIHVFEGDIRDTAALEHWVASLPLS